MAITFVQSKSQDGQASPSSATAFATAVAVGDLIVVATGQDSATTGIVTNVSDSLGNSYTAIPAFATYNSGNISGLTGWYTRVTVAGSSNVITVTFNATSTNVNFVAQHFNGFTSTATFDQKSTTVTAISNTTMTSGASPATIQATELVVGMGVYNASGAATLGAGYTNLGNSPVLNRSVAMESKVVASTGAQTATFTIPSSVSIGGVATFSDGAAVGGTTAHNLTLLGVGA